MAAVGKETFTKRVENGAEKCKQFQMAFLQLGCGLMNCLLKTMLVIDVEALKRGTCITLSCATRKTMLKSWNVEATIVYRVSRVGTRSTMHATRYTVHVTLFTYRVSCTRLLT